MDLVRPKALVGRREANKGDKLRRIKEAARALFISNGYDDTMTREIAIRANVAIGTVFTYAANKRDLLFLVVNDELDDIASQAEAAPREDRALLDNLLAAFGLLYGFFSQQPQLSRMTLREMLFYELQRAGDAVFDHSSANDRARWQDRAYGTAARRSQF